MSYVEEIDRLTAERDVARENARVRTGVAHALDRLNKEAIAKAERERDEARAALARVRALPTPIWASQLRDALDGPEATT